MKKNLSLRLIIEKEDGLPLFGIFKVEDGSKGCMLCGAAGPLLIGANEIAKVCYPCIKLSFGCYEHYHREPF